MYSYRKAANYLKDTPHFQSHKSSTGILLSNYLKPGAYSLSGRFQLTTRKLSWTATLMK